MEILQERKYATIAAGNGDNTVVEAVVGSRIRVLGYILSPAGAVVAKFMSGATELTNKIQFVGAVIQPFSSGFMPDGWFQTAANTALVLNLSGAVVTGVQVVYVLV